MGIRGAALVTFVASAECAPLNLFTDAHRHHVPAGSVTRV
jgi:hypothetical protein